MLPNERCRSREYDIANGHASPVSIESLSCVLWEFESPLPVWFSNGMPQHHGAISPQNRSKQHRAYETKMRDPKYRWGQFLNQAKQRGLAVGISFETYQQLIYSACHYCSQYPTSQTRIGIDRLDSCGDYEITNCVPCCARCNFMKGSLNYREFINHARLIAFSMRTRDLPYTPAPLLEPPFETCGKRRKRAS